MRGEDGPTDPWINPERARFVAPIAKTFIWAAALLGGGVTIGRGYQEMAHKFASVEARQADLPTKADLTEQRREYEIRMRRLLEEASWWCPPAIKTRPSVWVECRVSFETEAAPPKPR
jgi:hypothetical protein